MWRLKSIFPLPLAMKRSVKRLCRNIPDSIAYRLTRPRSELKNISHIVFVCKGNICRSAFAKYYLRYLKGDHSNNLKIESCGLDTNQGFGSPPDAVQAARELGISLTSHTSTLATEFNLMNTDLIVAMEYWHYSRLKTNFPKYKEKIRLLREFAPWPDRFLCNTYDPFGLGIDEFRSCFGHMQKALDRLWGIIEK